MAVKTNEIQPFTGTNVTINSNHTILKILHLTPQSTPSSPTEGDIYCNSSDHKLYFYNGSGWNEFVFV